MADLKLLNRTLIHSGKVFSLIVDEVEYPSGKRGVREVAHHPGGAVVVPIANDGRLLLVRQFRYPHQQYVTELPAGKLDSGEEPLHCAQRELQEETGFTASTWAKLTSIYTSPGFCDETLHLFLAQGLQPSPKGQSLEEGELSLTIQYVTFAEAVAAIERGEIVDSKTICGILLAEKILKLK